MQRDELLTQKERRRATFAVEKDDIVDLVLKAWDESILCLYCCKPKSWC